MPRPSPTLRRRVLSAELRRLREGAGLTGTQVAQRLGWSPSKVSRAETDEWKIVAVEDVATHLDALGANDEDRARLLTLARDARKKGWWHAYDEVSDDYGYYIGLEAGSTMVRNFEPQVVPGLLQTPAYARELIRGRRQVTAERIDALVEVRMERQHLITDPAEPLELWAVIDESVLHRMVGGPEVMAEQLEHLAKMAELPHVTLQVVPFDRGATMGTGPFVILRFAGGFGPEATYVETAAGPVWIEEKAAVDKFRLTFEELIADALSVEATIKRTATAAAMFRSSAKGHNAASGMA